MKLYKIDGLTEKQAQAVLCALERQIVGREWCCVDSRTTDRAWRKVHGQLGGQGMDVGEINVGVSPS